MCGMHAEKCQVLETGSSVMVDTGGDSNGNDGANITEDLRVKKLTCQETASGQVRDRVGPLELATNMINRTPNRSLTNPNVGNQPHSANWMANAKSNQTNAKQQHATQRPLLKSPVNAPSTAVVASVHHQHEHPHHHHHHHQQIRPHNNHTHSCLAPKLVSNNGPVTHNKHHQPHCVHHNPSCQRHQVAHSAEASPGAGEGRCRAFKHVSTNQNNVAKHHHPDKSYVLVEYHRAASALPTPHNHHHGHHHQVIESNGEGHSRGARYSKAVVEQTNQGCAMLRSGGNNERATIRFISQLYFLIHLSAVLSLLFHHKSLVASERKSMQQHSSADDTIQLATDASNLMYRRTIVANESLAGAQIEHQVNRTSSGRVHQTNAPGSISNPLPVPLMQADNNLQNSTNEPDQRHRQQSHLLLLTSNTDILVRLIGFWHAKYALHYFLGYLLASSVAILVGWRLLRLCNWRRSKYNRKIRHHQQQQHLQTAVGGECLQAATSQQESIDTSKYGFYYRTRLDCTPVLIGCISLGLIQLIVIGLDIANNFDWLSESRWFSYLSLIQFAFVALLMQYILGRVTKSQERRKQHNRHDASSLLDRQASAADRGGGGAATTATGGDELDAMKRYQFNAQGGSGNNGRHSTSIMVGLQNIALAHLLVTHILLWLIKLNSINLFQAIEHQSQIVLASPPTATTTSHIFLSLNESSSTVGSAAERQKPITIVALAPLNETTPRSSRSTEQHNGSGFDTNGSNHNKHQSMGNHLLQRPSVSLESLSPSHNQTTTISEPPPLIRLSSPVRNLNESRGETAAKSVETNFTTVTPHSRSVRVVETRSRPIDLTGDKATSGPSANIQPWQSVPVSKPAKAPGMNATVIPIKSSIPKRTTFFRQRRPGEKSLVPIAISSSSNIHKSAETIAAAQPVLTKKIQSLDSGKPDRRQQRARVVVTTNQGEDFSRVEPQTPRNKAIHLDERKKVSWPDDISHPIKVNPATTDRPFPSVESDPPPPASQLADTFTRAMDTWDRQAPTTVASAVQIKRKLANPDNTDDGDKSTTTAEPEPQANELESKLEADDGQPEEVDKADLDSLLPPVPNYEEQAATALSLPSKEPSKEDHHASQPSTNNTKKQRRFSHLPEEAFAFNEAATEQQVTAIESPISSALSMPSQQSQNSQQRVSDKEPLTFAEYLLPIVHQYHILIIAILFHLWLESLRKSPPAIRHPHPASSGRIISSRELLKSRSMDSLHHQHLFADEGRSSASSSSRYNSLKSSSSEKLLWLPSNSRFKSSARARSPLLFNRISRSSSMVRSNVTQFLPASKNAASIRQRTEESGDDDTAASLSVCSVFFGLLVVSTSLIVILVGINLLSVITQCLAQLISILVCLLGLCLSWRIRTRRAHKRRRYLQSADGWDRRYQKNVVYLADGQVSGHTKSQTLASSPNPVPNHRQCFHYLFLLAAYYCGISIALNLGKQHSPQQLFSPQVLQFMHRHLSFSLFRFTPRSRSDVLASYLALFHLVLVLKGLLLIVQVTLQTILIRSSCQRATRELRQIYTFLMFANLSLWAMEICEQQQHLQRDTSDIYGDNDKLRLLTLDSFNRFAASVVTLSHLYHGLVFMQH